MIKSRGMKFRLHVLEALEDRAVPSTLGVSANATTSPTTVQAELTKVDNAINAGYSAFASAVYPDELSLERGMILVYPGGGPTTVAALTTAINQQIAILEQTLTTAVSGTISNNALGLIQSQINGSAKGSLVNGMAEILDALTAEETKGYVPPPSYSLLATAIEGEINASLTSATVDAYLAATERGSAATSNFNLGKTDGQVDTDYGSLASTITQAESALYLYPTFGVYIVPPFTTTSITPYPGTATSDPYTVTTITTVYPINNPTIPADESEAVSTAANVVKIVDSQVGALAQSIGSLLSKTSKAGLIQAQLDGSGSSSLLTQVNSLYNAAALSDSSDGSIPTIQAGLLIASVDAAISASDMSTSVEAYLLAIA